MTGNHWYALLQVVGYPLACHLFVNLTPWLHHLCNYQLRDHAELKPDVKVVLEKCRGTTCKFARS